MCAKNYFLFMLSQQRYFLFWTGSKHANQHSRRQTCMHEAKLCQKWGLIGQLLHPSQCFHGNPSKMLQSAPTSVKWKSRKIHTKATKWGLVGRNNGTKHITFVGTHLNIDIAIAIIIIILVVRVDVANSHSCMRRKHICMEGGRCLPWGNLG